MAFVIYSSITKLICWKNFVNLRDFYLISLWNFLLGGLGWSSRTVRGEASFLKNCGLGKSVHIRGCSGSGYVPFDW